MVLLGRETMDGSEAMVRSRAPRSPGALGDALARAATERAGEPAVVSERSRTSHRDLHERAIALATHLAGAERCVLVFRNDPTFVVAYAACALAGITAVPMHPAYGAERVATLIDRTGADAVLCDPSDESVVAFLGAGRRVAVAGALGPGTDLDDATTWPARPHRLAGLEPSQDAVILCSSGSTGAPKLVRRSAGRLDLAATTYGAAWGASADTTFGVGSMIGHAAALGWGVHAALLTGATLAVPVDRSPAGLARSMPDMGVDVAFLVPSQGRAVLAHAPSWPRRLRRVILGGERLAPELARGLRADVAAEVQDTYGMSEGFCTATDPSDLQDIEQGTVGRPCLHDDEVRVDDDGRLHVRSRTILDGYLDGPDPFDGDGWFDTGDLAALDDEGRIRWLGRATRTIVRGAVKVAPEELELHVAEHPDVMDVAVVGLPDERLGERICALVVPAAGRAPARASIIEHLEARGVGRLRHPDDVVVVPRLEKNAVGKTDWHAIADRARRTAHETQGRNA